MPISTKPAAEGIESKPLNVLIANGQAKAIFFFFWPKRVLLMNSDLIRNEVMIAFKFILGAIGFFP